MQKNTSGTNNMAIGYNTVHGLSDGTNNIANNMAIGHNTVHGISEGNNNIAIGHNTVHGISEGNNNIAIGPRSAGGASLTQFEQSKTNGILDIMRATTQSMLMLIIN